MINRAMTVQVFLLIGWLFRKYGELIKEQAGKTWLLFGGSAVYIALGVLSVIIYPGEVLDVHLNKYYNYVFCQLMIWIGIGILFVFASKHIQKYPKWWVLIGQNTLVIYLLHSFVVKAGIKAFSLLHLPVNRMTNILLTVIVISVCLRISLLIKKFIPVLMGKKRKVSPN